MNIKFLLVLLYPIVFISCSKVEETNQSKNNSQITNPVIYDYEKEIKSDVEKYAILVKECSDKLIIPIGEFSYVKKKPECEDAACRLNALIFEREYGTSSKILTIFNTKLINKINESYTVQSYCSFDYPELKMLGYEDGRKTKEQRNAEGEAALKHFLENYKER